ncbi:PKD domain-containing protein [Spirosoma soli]|uniref:PKD domain-containing protein n=1 Tax=Spirosoma soli TaxID=1770529 RepID=A0ABW5M4C5_9BACT
MKNYLLFLVLLCSSLFTACSNQGREDAVNPHEPTPTVDFSFQENSTGDMTFATTTTGKITSYSWSFGDQQTSNEVNPIHPYNRNKTYSVSLKVKGPGGEAVTSKLVETKNVEGTVIFWTSKIYIDVLMEPQTSVGIWFPNTSPLKFYSPPQIIKKSFSSAPPCSTEGAATFKGKDGDTVYWNSNGSSSPFGGGIFYGYFTFVGRECKNVKIE